MSLIAETATTLVHGYTLDDLDHFADQAVRRTRIMAKQVDADEARQEALSAISSTLFSSLERPTKAALIDVGAQRVGRIAAGVTRDMGLRRVEGGGYEKAPHFRKYWASAIGADMVEKSDGTLAVRLNQPDWTDELVMRLAIPQVLAVLTPAQYEAVLTLAKYGSAPAAAAALGVVPSSLNRRLVRARREMEAAWFGDETAPAKPGHKGDAVRCRHGHRRDLYGFTKSNGHKGCRKCERAAVHRYEAKQEHDVDLEDTVVEQLHFAPAISAEPEGARLVVNGWVVIGTTACWCGLHYGHDWAGKLDGAPHPASYEEAAA